MSEELDLKDELEMSDELEVELDKDIGSDLDDLLSDDEAELNSVSLEEETTAASDDGLDELDAFLDDFEKNLDVDGDEESESQDGEDAPQPATVQDETGTEEESITGQDAALELDEEAQSESVSADSLEDELEAELNAVTIEEEDAEEPEQETAAGIGGRELELDKSDLDLDVGLGDETAAGESAAPEESADQEQSTDVEPAQQAEKDLDEAPVAEAAAATAASAIMASTATAATTPPSTAAVPALGKPLLIGGGFLLVASLLLSLGALWIGVGLGSQIDTLNQNVSELQQRVIAQSRRGSISPQVQLGEQLNQLGERVNELAVIIEGPMAHLQESNRVALQELGERIDNLDKPTSVAMPVATPAVADKTPPSKPAIAAKKQGGWVINLLSVASRKTARSELARLKRMGVNADRKEVKKGNKTWYRLRVTGYQSYNEAKSDIKALEQKTGFSSAWVGKE